MTFRSRTGAHVAVIVGLLACSQPSNYADVEGTLVGDSLVFDASSGDGEQAWSVDLVIENAPPGEYLVFESSERPTSIAALASFTPAECGAECVVPGLGRYAGKDTHTISGRLAIRSEQSDYTDRRSFVLVRRALSTTPLAGVLPDLPVKARVLISAASGGCGGGNPDSPGVTSHPL